MIVGYQCRIAMIRVYVAKMKQDYATTSRNVRGWKKVIDMRSYADALYQVDRLNKTIGDVAYILDILMAYRNIVKSGNCNTCVGKCGDYKPKPGQMAVFNCPFYEGGEQDG